MIDNYDDMCRDLGHAWNYLDAKVEGRVATSILQCKRCQTRRTQKIGTNTGKLLTGGSYSYPSGYTRKGQGRFTAKDRANLRKKRFKA